MAMFGRIVIALAFAGCVYAIPAALFGAQSRRRPWIVSSLNAVHAVTLLLTASIMALAFAFLSDDFSLMYVAHHSSIAQPDLYKVTAVWGGQSGSLLLWVWLLSLFGSAALHQNRRRHPRLVPYAAAAIAFAMGFFIFLMLFVEHPFATFAAGQAPRDGQGLNPLLQNPYMAIHPPCLYTGYVGFSVPFAFAVAALATGRLGTDWLRATRRWTLFSWAFLSVGILLGAHWAYLELGWGGYWAWDPVENASFMPWLAGTAYLHSVIIQEKRNMLKVWNMVLVFLTYGLAIFGTFLTRSGVISSVHSFAQSDLGPFFLWYLAFVVAAAVMLLVWRRHELATPNRFDSMVSRESAFLLNNLLLLAAVFAVLWGTIFPILSEAVEGTKITVGPPYFNRVMSPIGLALLALTGIGPMVAWRRASPGSLRRAFIIPVGVMAAAMAAMATLGAGLAGTMSWGLCVFVLMTISMEFWRGTIARHTMTGESYPAAFAGLIQRNRRRYGGYVVHLGIVMIFAGITGSLFNAESEGVLKPGEALTVDRYTLRFDEAKDTSRPDFDGVAARVSILDGQRLVTILEPEKRRYHASRQPTTEASVLSSFREDIYLTLGEVHADGSISLQAHVNPLVRWLWAGGVVLVLGTVIGAWPEAARQRATVSSFAMAGAAAR